MSSVLDIEKSARRNIKSGLQYDHLFPSANMLDKIVYRDGNVKDTVKEMQNVVHKYLDDTKLIAPKLKDKTLEATCYNIWKFLHDHCQYKLDQQGLEQLRRPARAWHDRVHGIDCDCYSIFVSSILTNLDMPHSFRITKYDRDWQHVYVVVPNPDGGHITIDCVPHHFDYEKPYTDKIDYHMTQLNGIPIAVLSGVGETPDDELYGILAGIDFDEVDRLEGLGIAPTEDQELTAIYNHLVRTRDYIVKNPKSVLTTGGAAAHLQMLNYAIENWNTPNRLQALETLEKEEERWNDHNGVNGFGDEDEINGLGALNGLKKFWSKVKETVKKVGEGAKKVVQKVGEGIKKVGQKIGEGVKKLGQAILKYNPLSLAVRGGFLLAMKINLLNMGSKLLPGYLTEAEAKAKGVSSDKWQKSKSAVAKIEDFFVNKLGGRADKLKSAIMSGRATKQFHGFGTLGEPATITAVVASAAPLIKAAQVLKDSGVSDSKDGDTSSHSGFIATIKKWWNKAFGKEDAVAPVTITDEDKQPNDKAATDESSSTTDVAERKAGNDSTASDDSGEQGGWAKFKNIIKENPGKVIGGTLLVASALTLAFSSKARAAVGLAQKPKPAAHALSGYKKKRRKPKPAHRKMKTIILK